LKPKNKLNPKYVIIASIALIAITSILLWTQQQNFKKQAILHNAAQISTNQHAAPITPTTEIKPQPAPIGDILLALKMQKLTVSNPEARITHTPANKKTYLSLSFTLPADTDVTTATLKITDNTGSSVNLITDAKIEDLRKNNNSASGPAGNLNLGKLSITASDNPATVSMQYSTLDDISPISFSKLTNPIYGTLKLCNSENLCKENSFAMQVLFD